MCSVESHVHRDAENPRCDPEKGQNEKGECMREYNRDSIVVPVRLVPEVIVHRAIVEAAPSWR